MSIIDFGCAVGRDWFPVLLVALVCSCPAGLGEAAADAPPDVVLILADDLGYSDLGCFGGEIHTPRLDRLARNGVRFTQFYNAARCCPTRAALLTGLYPHLAGVGHMTYDAGEPGYRGRLSPQSVTIAEVLHSVGYQTMMCGKWHVTHQTAPDGPRGDWPPQRGFDSFYGTLPGHGSFWDPAGLMDGNTPVDPEPGFFYTDAIADHAVSYLAEATRSDRPFFLYVAFTAPHYPLHARPETIARYDGVYDDGWEVTRQRRFARMKKLGIVEADQELSPPDEAVDARQAMQRDGRPLDGQPLAPPNWEDEPHRAWQAHRMQVYAAMVDELDQAVGRIVDALADSRRLDNTLLVFLSDNGASSEGHLDNMIERMNEPWISSLIPEKTPDGRPVSPGDIPGRPLGGPESYGSYGLRWASVSNTPFRRHKSWVHEGGIAAPCIVHWPRRVTERGELCRSVCHVIDILPTLAKLSGAEYLMEVDGRPIPPPSGVSLCPLLEGESLERETLCWEHEGNRAIRHGRWKLVSEYPGTWTTFFRYPNQGRWELYDLQTDRAELNDLADQHPDIVADLARRYDQWAARTQVVPWDELEGKKE